MYKKLVAVIINGWNIGNTSVDLDRFVNSIPNSKAKDFLIHCGVFSPENVAGFFPVWINSEQLSGARILLKIPDYPVDIRQPPSALGYFRTVFAPNSSNVLDLGLVTASSGDVIAIVQLIDTEIIGHNVISLVPYLPTLEDLVTSAKTDPEDASVCRRYADLEKDLHERLKASNIHVKFINKQPFVVVQFANRWSSAVTIESVRLKNLYAHIKHATGTIRVLWAGPTVYPTGNYHGQFKSRYQSATGAPQFISPFLSTGPAVDTFFLHALLEAIDIGDHSSLIETCSGSGTLMAILAHLRSESGPLPSVTAIEYNPWAIPFLRQNLRSTLPGADVSVTQASAFSLPITDPNALLLANSPACDDLSDIGKTGPPGHYEYVWDNGEIGISFFFQLLKHLDTAVFRELVLWNNFYAAKGDPGLYILRLHPLLDVREETRLRSESRNEIGIATYWVRKKGKEELLDQLPEKDPQNRWIFDHIIQRALIGAYAEYNPETESSLFAVIENSSKLTQTRVAQLVLALLLGKLSAYPKVILAFNELDRCISKIRVAHHLLNWASKDGIKVSVPVYRDDQRLSVVNSERGIGLRLRRLKIQQPIIDDVVNRYSKVSARNIFLFHQTDLSLTFLVPGTSWNEIFVEEYHNPYHPFFVFLARLCANSTLVIQSHHPPMSLAEFAASYQDNLWNLPGIVVAMIQHLKSPVSLQTFLKYQTAHPATAEEITPEYLTIATGIPGQRMMMPASDATRWFEPGKSVGLIESRWMQLGEFRFAAIYAQLPSQPEPQITVVIDHPQTRRTKTVIFKIDELTVSESQIELIYGQVSERLASAMQLISIEASTRTNFSQLDEPFIRSLLLLAKFGSPTDPVDQIDDLEIEQDQVEIAWPLQPGQAYRKGSTAAFWSNCLYASDLEIDASGDYVVYASNHGRKTSSPRIQEFRFPGRLLELIQELPQRSIKLNTLLAYLSDMFMTQLIVSNSESFSLSQAPLSKVDHDRLVSTITMATWLYRENNGDSPILAAAEKVGSKPELTLAINLAKSAPRLLNPKYLPTTTEERLFVAGVRLSLFSYPNIAALNNLGFELISQLDLDLGLAPALENMRGYSVDLMLAVEAFNQTYIEIKFSKKLLNSALRTLASVLVPFSGRVEDIRSELPEPTTNRLQESESRILRFIEAVNSGKAHYPSDETLEKLALYGQLIVHSLPKGKYEAPSERGGSPTFNHSKFCADVLRLYKPVA